MCNVPVWSSQIVPGPRRRHSLTFLPTFPLFATEKMFLVKPNALKWSYSMYKEVLLLLMPFRSKHFDAFDLFCHFRSLYTYTPCYGYNEFDWLTLILHSKLTCRLSFGIVSARPFCIMLSDFPYLLLFSNNFPLKRSKGIHEEFVNITYHSSFMISRYPSVTEMFANK